MAREKWLLKVQLPENVDNGGSYMARLLKHLLRAWCVKCLALLDTLPETHWTAQDRRSENETAQPPASKLEGEREKPAGRDTNREDRESC